MNLSNIEQGVLVVADVLFAEQIGVKRRLALVISNTSFNKKSEDVIILKVTSNFGNTNYDISLTNDQTLNKQLKKESAIMVDFPMTISKQNIYFIPDKINLNKLIEVKKKLIELYEL